MNTTGNKIDDQGHDNMDAQSNARMNSTATDSNSDGISDVDTTTSLDESNDAANSNGDQYQDVLFAVVPAEDKNGAGTVLTGDEGASHHHHMATTRNGESERRTSPLQQSGDAAAASTVDDYNVGMRATHEQPDSPEGLAADRVSLADVNDSGTKTSSKTSSSRHDSDSNNNSNSNNGGGSCNCNCDAANIHNEAGEQNVDLSAHDDLTSVSSVIPSATLSLVAPPRRATSAGPTFLRNPPNPRGGTVDHIVVSPSHRFRRLRRQTQFYPHDDKAGHPLSSSPLRRTTSWNGSLSKSDHRHSSFTLSASCADGDVRRFSKGLLEGVPLPTAVSPRDRYDQIRKSLSTDKSHRATDKDSQQSIMKRSADAAESAALGKHRRPVHVTWDYTSRTGATDSSKMMRTEHPGDELLDPESLGGSIMDNSDDHDANNTEHGPSTICNTNMTTGMSQNPSPRLHDPSNDDDHEMNVEGMSARTSTPTVSFNDPMPLSMTTYPAVVAQEALTQDELREAIRGEMETEYREKMNRGIDLVVAEPVLRSVVSARPDRTSGASRNDWPIQDEERCEDAGDGDGENIGVGGSMFNKRRRTLRVWFGLVCIALVAAIITVVLLQRKSGTDDATHENGVNQYDPDSDFDNDNEATSSPTPMRATTEIPSLRPSVSVTPTITSTTAPSTDPSASPSTSPTNSFPQSDQFFAILDLLAPSLLAPPTSINEAAFADPGSIPHKVLDWMARPQNDHVAQMISGANHTNHVNTVRRLLEHYSFISLHYSMNGEGWTVDFDLPSDGDICGWNDGSRGIECQEDGYIVSLLLPDTNVQGDIDPALYNLRSLEDVQLQANPITGSLSSHVGDLTNLRALQLHESGLSGELPTTLGALTKLEIFRSLASMVSGKIPTEIGQCTLLSDLEMSRCQLTGQIPSELGKLTKLNGLWVHSNQLKGRVPTQIGRLTAMTRLWLYENKLTGPLPTEIGKLTDLDRISIRTNLFTGSIPSELGNLNKLSILFAYSAGLTGTLPTEMGKLTKMQNMQLHDNRRLRGTIPSEMKNLTMMEVLSISECSLSGRLPAELGRMEALYELHLQDNRLDGPIPKEWGALTRLQAMYLFENSLSGQIPSELGELTALTYLWAYKNLLTGPIPSQIGNLRRLTSLSLHTNALSNTLPPEIGSLDRLTLLSIGANRISGPIPSELGQISSLTSIRIQVNRFNETIPPELGNLHRLSNLGLFRNQLTGAIPTEVGKMTSLTLLSVRENQLIGTLPTELGKLTRLTLLYVFSNNMVGPIPSEVGKLSKMKKLRMYDNGFNGTIPTQLAALTKLTNLSIRNTLITGNLDPIFCSGSSMLSDPAALFWADCNGDPAEGILSHVVCSCCTACCGPLGCVEQNENAKQCRGGCVACDTNVFVASCEECPISAQQESGADQSQQQEQVCSRSCSMNETSGICEPRTVFGNATT